MSRLCVRRKRRKTSATGAIAGILTFQTIVGTGWIQREYVMQWTLSNLMADTENDDGVSPRSPGGSFPEGCLW